MNIDLELDELYKKLDAQQIVVDEAARKSIEERNKLSLIRIEIEQVKRRKFHVFDDLKN